MIFYLKNLLKPRLFCVFLPSVIKQPAELNKILDDLENIMVKFFDKYKALLLCNSYQSPLRILRIIFFDKDQTITLEEFQTSIYTDWRASKDLRCQKFRIIVKAWTSQGEEVRREHQRGRSQDQNQRATPSQSSSSPIVTKLAISRSIVLRKGARSLSKRV